MTLAEMFRMRRQSIEKRLANCPVFTTGQDGQPLYQVFEAAPYLVRVKLTEQQVAKAIRDGDPRDFPAMTNKMFWEGMTQRRKYEEQVGELWHTTDVAGVAAQAFNAIRMSLMLLPDELNDKAGLNDQQRVIVEDTLDAALENCGKLLVEELEKPSRSEQNAEDEDDDI